MEFRLDNIEYFAQISPRPGAHPARSGLLSRGTGPHGSTHGARLGTRLSSLDHWTFLYGVRSGDRPSVSICNAVPARPGRLDLGRRTLFVGADDSGRYARYLPVFLSAPPRSDH